MKFTIFNRRFLVSGFFLLLFLYAYANTRAAPPSLNPESLTKAYKNYLAVKPVDVFIISPKKLAETYKNSITQAPTFNTTTVVSAKIIDAYKNFIVKNTKLEIIAVAPEIKVAEAIPEKIIAENPEPEPAQKSGLIQAIKNQVAQVTSSVAFISPINLINAYKNFINKPSVVATTTPTPKPTPTPSSIKITNSSSNQDLTIALQNLLNNPTVYSKLRGPAGPAGADAYFDPNLYVTRNFFDGQVDVLLDRIGDSNNDSGGGGGSSDVENFTDLDDAPSSYTGHASKVVRVNAGETALEFVTLAGGGDALTADPLSQFAATTSAQLDVVISDDTGSGALVFATSPTLVTPDLGTPSAVVLTNASGTATALNIGGNAATATALQNIRTINGTNFDGTVNITITAAAGTLTGTTLNSSVVTSSLTTVGVLNSGSITSGFGSIDLGTDAITTTGAISTDTLTLTGTGTLNGLDVLDGTSESTIESAIDTLANLTSASSLATVGALDSGSITSGFGAINIGVDNITLGSLDASGTLQAGSSNVTLTLATGFIDADALSLYTPALNGASTTTSTPSGLEVVSDELTLLQGCGDGQVLRWEEDTDTWDCGSAAGGYTNLTEFVDQTAWRLFYSNGSGDVTELALGADGTFLKSNGAASAPTFATPAGSGDVSKVGSPSNNQMAVWTGDGTLEGTSDFTYDGTSLNLITAKNFQIAGTTILADSAGTTTLSGIDAVDATTEATIETAIDTLANLTSASGLVTVGVLNSGSITSGFGSIDLGGDTITTTGTISTDTLTLTNTGTLNGLDALDATSESTIEAAIDTLGALTINGNMTFDTGNNTAGSITMQDGGTTYATISDTGGVGDTGRLSLQGGGEARLTGDGTGYLLSTTGVASFGFGDSTPDYTVEIHDAVTTPSLSLSDDDIAHGLTDLAQTDVFYHLTSLSTTSGGAQLTAISDTDSQALSVRGVIGSTNPTDATPAIRIIGAKSDGSTGIADLGATETVFAVTNNNDADAFTIVGNSNATFAGDLTISGGDLTFGTSLILSGGDTTSLNLIDAIDATTESTIEAAIDTLANLTSASSLVTVGILNSGSITSGFGSIDLGGDTITTTGTISTDTLTLTNTGTLNGLDALDATSESTIEAAIDTLANLTSASSLVTVGILNSGSITSGFGSIDLGTDTITTTGAISTDTLTLTGTGTLNGLDALDSTSESTIEAAIDTLVNLTSNLGINDNTADYHLEIHDATTTPAFALSDDDVVHGLTTLAETDVFYHLTSLSTTSGGAEITTISDTDSQALSIRGVIGSTDPTDATPAIKFVGAKSNGTTGMADLGAAETVFAIANNDDTSAFVMLGSGNVGIGTTGPDQQLDVLDAAAAQLRLTQADGSAYSEFQTDASGDLVIDTTGDDVRITDGDLWICAGGSCAASNPSGTGNIIVENAVKFDNNFTLVQTTSTVVEMRDSGGNTILQFDEGS